MWRLELFEPARPIFGWIAPPIGESADESARRDTIAKVDPVIGDHLINNGWELAPGTSTFKLVSAFAPRGAAVRSEAKMILFVIVPDLDHC